MIANNYTSIKKREKRLYSAFNTTVSQTGIAFKTIQTSGVFLFIFGIFGLLFCMITGTFWYNPLSLAGSSSAGYFYIIFVFAPVVLGVTVNTVKVQNYKLIDYLKIYFTPKIPVDQDGKKIKVQGYIQEGFVEII